MNRKVMIATPVYDGKVELDFMTSLFNTLELCMLNNIEMTMKTVIGCSLIQKARNELFKLAYEAEVNDLIFIDSDQSWTKEDFGRLLDAKGDVVGGAVVSKNDLVHFNVKTFEPSFKFDGDMIEARAIGTGFFRITKRAIKMMWEASDEYVDGEHKSRNVFEVKVVDGQLVGEDVCFCDKWRALGEKVYVHPSISISHIGKKRYSGSFEDYVRIANDKPA
jgi:hypothetical protein